MSSRKSPMDAFTLARALWLDGRPLDMSSLAAELGTSRATLNRSVGNKNRLLTEVLWSLAAYTFERAQEECRPLASGPEYVVAVIERFAGNIAHHSATRAFLAQNPEYGLRILTSQESQLRRRTTSATTSSATSQTWRRLPPPSACCWAHVPPAGAPRADPPTMITLP